MKSFNRRLSAAALVLISGTALMAQGSDGYNNKNKDSAIAVRNDGTTDHRSTSLIPTDWVVGEKVIDTSGQKLGRIDDLVLDAGDGHVVYALLNRDATDTMPGTTVAVPWMAFTWDSTTKTVSLPMDRALLAGAGEFDPKRWELLQDETWVDRTYDYFKVDQAEYSDLWEDDAIEDKDRTDSGDKPVRDSSVPAQRDHVPATPDRDRDAKDKDYNDKDHKDHKDHKDTMGTPANDGTHYVLSSKVNGQTLRGSEDKQIGEVKELVFDANSGRMAFIVATFGGFLGVGDSKVAVPWDYFKVNDEGHLYTNDISADVVRNAPRLDRADWADLKDPDFGPRVYTHYGRDPSWFESNSGGRVLGTDRGIDLNDRGDNDDYVALYTTGSDTEVSGTVVRTSHEEPMSGVGDVKTVVIKTDSGDRLVHLAPDTYLTEKECHLKEGDRVAIKGRTATVNGKQVVIASSYKGVDGKDITLRDEQGVPMWSGDR